MKRTLAAFAAASGAKLLGEDRAFGPVSTDSRTLPADALFVALRGERFDGHDFAAAAVERGAVAALVERDLGLPVPQLVADDSLAALSAAAAAWRAGFGIPVVGVAGSNGKTSTKELVAAILAERGPVLATRGSLNNHIGVPLTLFGIGPEHRAAVIEIGANHPGEVAALAALARPTVGLVTNAGAEHLEGFGSLDGVARAEGELYEGLPGDGTAVVNADDAYAGLWRGMCAAGRIVTFGTGEADVRARGARLAVEDGAWATRFALDTPQGVVSVRLALPGLHNVMNAAGAAAAALACGATLAQVAGGLARVQPVAGRLQLKAGTGGAWIVDDSYNANPSSAIAGLDVLAALPGEHWLVLGEMAELGLHAEAAHAEVGRHARLTGVTRLDAVGEHARHAVAAFGEGGRWHLDAPSLVDALRPALRPDVTVLVKGSRVNRLERVVGALEAPPARAAGATH
ncbi:MAG: UDP-N-acetylmuramoyl-tripeptide--D-alanyl-D-alanine ligase [Steroidobacteraceae bacterium]|jgi:UDP-N-acetylmuramoyl-tripeptide--D-alanyl-D-alanine ligase|nr:UDP-N-acetylmuramoyl-tripeptide--D-alanyl-D-alanine ligase [Steroidobacteraceae bacterium]